MTSPTKVAAFHREFDRHPDDRVRLFGALSELAPSSARVLYPGSYVDIAPSIWFDDVTYVDIDKRAARFFSEQTEVERLIIDKKSAAGRNEHTPSFRFHHLDYSTALPIGDSTIDVLVSLYAGFITESCTRYLKPGGLILVNNSHGDASMATLDDDNELVAAVQSRGGGYRIDTTNLADYLKPKRGQPPTAEELHNTNRGVAFTKPAFAYVFANRRVASI